MEGPPKEEKPKLTIIDGGKTQAEHDQSQKQRAEVVDAELEYMSSDPAADEFVFRDDLPANTNEEPTSE